MTNTYYARVDYTYTSGDRFFSIPFSYIKDEHIKVYVNDEETTNFTFNTATQIVVNDTLVANDVVSIVRNTPINNKMVVFTNTSILNKDNQNLAQDQVFDAIQEIYDNNTIFKDDVGGRLETAESNASTALTNANTAVTTANTANTKADNAVSTANTASTNASTALTNSNTALTNSTTAVSTANAASTKVDELEEDIDEVIEAAEKINELEEAVELATTKASEASASATTASTKATEATTAAATATQKAQEATEKLEIVGDLDDLTTTDKDTIVDAINEVNAKDTLPSQTGNADKFLKTNGTTASWEKIALGTKFAINKGNPSLLVNNSTSLGFNVSSSDTLTYTDINGNSRTVTSLDSIDVSSVADGTYKVVLPASGTTPTLFSGTIFNQETEPQTEIAFVQPTLSANGTLGGTSFAVIGDSKKSSTYDYYMAFDGNTATGWTNEQSGNATATGYLEFYNPKPIKVSSLQMSVNEWTTTTSSWNDTINVYGSNDGTAWTQIVTNFSSGSYTSTPYLYNIPVNSSSYYKYYKIENTSQAYSSSYGYGWNVIEVGITATVYAEYTNAIWLNPQEPYTAKQYDGTTWNDYNNVILQDSSVTIASGVITDLTQPKYNSNHIQAKTVITETYINGTSGYRIWSDGYCEQWIKITSGGTTTFLKTFANTNYTILSAFGENLSDVGAFFTNITTNSVTANNVSNPTWIKICGYLAQGQY